MIHTYTPQATLVGGARAAVSLPFQVAPRGIYEGAGNLFPVDFWQGLDGGGLGLDGVGIARRNAFR